MNVEKYIVIEGPSLANIRNVAQKLADLYADSGFTNGIIIYQSTKKENLYLLSFENNPDFERFKYFVNYLVYPELESYTARVFGFWTIGSDDRLPKIHLGQRAMLYVSENDTEGDNVHVAFEHTEKAFKLGFAFGEEYVEMKEKGAPFSESKIDERDFVQVCVVVPTVIPTKKKGSGCSLAVFGFLMLLSLVTWAII